MFWSNYFIPTLKDTASEDAQVISNSLMLKSGMIRKKCLWDLYMASAWFEGFK